MPQCSLIFILRVTQGFIQPFEASGSLASYTIEPHEGRDATPQLLTGLFTHSLSRLATYADVRQHYTLPSLPLGGSFAVKIMTMATTTAGAATTRKGILQLELPAREDRACGHNSSITVM
jgi:hypothetical protein